MMEANISSRGQNWPSKDTNLVHWTSLWPLILNEFPSARGKSCLKLLETKVQMNMNILNVSCDNSLAGFLFHTSVLYISQVPRPVQRQLALTKLVS